MAAPKPTSLEHLEAVSASLDSLTTRAGQHSADPKDHLHAPSDNVKGHIWLKVFSHTQEILEKFENSRHFGNFVIDRQTRERTFEPMSIYVRVGMHLLYYGTAQEKVLQWERTKKLLKVHSEKMGQQYDVPESKDHIQPFIKSFNLQGSLHEMKEPDPTKYATFNEFFAREIKASARPIAEPKNKAVVSSPADCRLTAFPTVDLATKYWIKGSGFTLARLFGDEALAQRFDGGSLLVARLAPQDYHLWHSPTGGKVDKISEITGTYYTVNPQAINEKGTLDVFCENRRSVMVLNRAGTGAPVAIVAVGAMLVGSIKYNQGVQEGAEVQRGQCLGAFYYGGSTVIVVYPKGEVTFDADLVETSTEQGCETFVKVGWRVGEGPN